MGKTAISILSVSLKLPPNNEFATEEGHFLTFEGTATVSESPLHSRCHQRCSRDRMQMDKSLCMSTEVFALIKRMRSGLVGNP